MKDLSSDEIFNVIGQNVRYYRKLYSLNKEKMTQEKLEELVDVSTALIGNLESEKISQGISVVTLWKISQALEVPIEKLFDYSNLKKKTS